MRRFECRVGPGGQLLVTDAEGYGVKLAVRGNFPSETHRREYVEELTRALNAAPIPTWEHTRWPLSSGAVNLTEKHTCY